MTVLTYEGVVEKGRIRLKSGVKLPDNIKVYVVVPDLQPGEKKVIQMLTPRLANPKQAADFKMAVTRIKSNAKIRR
ncbi:MAG: hypothetical protein HND47_20135 [Chloroflexi bacterium]|nr:hypothetical protein [Chloroflexota bacterium]